MKCGICGAWGPGFIVTFPDSKVGKVTLCPSCLDEYVDPKIGEHAEVVKA